MKTSPLSILFLLPVYNEEVQLADSVATLMQWANANLDDRFTWRIAVGDNASTDATPTIAKRLAKEYPGKVEHVRLEQKGRGRMLKKVWGELPFDISLYMDVDLSTGLQHITPCLEAVASGKYDLAVGSRNLPSSKVTGRSLKREITSRGYVAIVRTVTGSRISDFQCGFKAITKRAAEHLLPYIEDTGWFFDTELVVLMEKVGYRVYQEGVQWQDDPGTTVNVVKTAVEDLRGLRRVLRTKVWRRIGPIQLG